MRFLLAGVATLRGNDPRQRNAGAGGKGLSFDYTPFDGLRAGRTGLVRGKQINIESFDRAQDRRRTPRETIGTSKEYRMMNYVRGYYVAVVATMGKRPIDSGAKCEFVCLSYI